jgi:hypothetical protein
VDALDSLTAQGSDQVLSYDEQMQLFFRRMQIGQLGEKLVFQSEVDRLIEAKQADLAERVEWISQIKPFVGYDICSFNVDSSVEYVEVKSSVGRVTRFNFTANELKVAEDYGEAYRLVCASYVVGQPRFREFRNPKRAINEGRLEVIEDNNLLILVK